LILACIEETGRKKWKWRECGMRDADL